MLIDKGADPNGAAQGWTALHAVTWVRRPNFGFNPPGPLTSGDVDSITFVKEMVKRGANVNARITKEVTNGYRNALNRIGATPLMMAARLADAPLMSTFLDLGADPTLTNEDKTTLLMVSAGVGIHSPGEDPAIIPYVPAQQRADAFSFVHDDPANGGHQGRDKTLERMRRHFYWPSMRKDVTKWVATCETCQLTKVPRQAKYGALKPIQQMGVFDQISMDVMDATERGASGHAGFW